MKQFLYVVVACLVVSGCDQVKSKIDNVIKAHNKESAIIIAPGHKINDHGNMRKVYGFSECPQPVMASLKSESGCIIVNPDDNVVSVFIDDGKSSKKYARDEVWVIERQHENIKFKRPDNSYVILSE